MSVALVLSGVMNCTTKSPASLITKKPHPLYAPVGDLLASISQYPHDVSRYVSGSWLEPIVVLIGEFSPTLSEAKSP